MEFQLVKQSSTCIQMDIKTFFFFEVLALMFLLAVINNVILFLTSSSPLYLGIVFLVLSSCTGYSRDI